MADASLLPGQQRQLAEPDFEQCYPPTIVGASALHWTPVAVAEAAARFLVGAGADRVLDIGSGVGKFSLVAASQHLQCNFVGIEQRANLVAVANAAAEHLRLVNVAFCHGNVADLDFADFGAFYFFNAFAEQSFVGCRLDNNVPFGPEHLRRYVSHLREQFAKAPVGTRLAIYSGGFLPPRDYRYAGSRFDGELQFFEKTNVA
jgi:SAM-dependent methyltransferase